MHTVYSQNYCFTKVDGVDLKGGHLGFASWCDYNSDNKMDVFVTGYDSGSDFTQAMIYKNNGDKNFSESNINNIPRVLYGALSWGDYNNDGYIDLLYSGTKSGSSIANITKMYKNEGNGIFTEIQTPLIQVGEGDVEWVDMNNDGKLDVFLMGISEADTFDLAVYKNNGNNSFEKKNVAISKISGARGNFTKCMCKWADFDNDGLKDIFVSMASNTDFSFKFYKNLGDFNFQEVNLELPKLNYMSMDIGDINQDGLIDLVYIGSPSTSLAYAEYNYASILLNKGNLNFDKINTNIGLSVFVNTLSLADYSNDGYPDLLYSGSGSNDQIKIYENDKKNSFRNTLQTILDSESGGDLFGDFNNNNTLDLLHYGRMTYPGAGGDATFIYENTISRLNQRPIAPTEIKLNADGNNLNFSWNTGSDDSTKTDGLYYNIRIGTITNPDSLISSNSDNNKLRFYHLGNMNKNRNFTFKDFPEGEYIVSVQSIDNSYNVSTFSNSLHFCFKHSSGIFGDTIKICNGDSVLLNAGSGYLSYAWNNGATTQTITVKNQGLYNVNLIDADNCIHSETVYLKVNELPKINLLDEYTISATDSLQLDGGSFNSYLWSTGDITRTIILSRSKLTLGKHILGLKVTDINGCSHNGSTLIMIKDNTFAKISEEPYNGHYFYPNPFKNEVKVNFSNLIDKKNIVLQVLNLNGSIIFEKKYSKNQHEELINLNFLLPGIYIFKINFDNGYITKRIIKIE